MNYYYFTFTMTPILVLMTLISPSFVFATNEQDMIVATQEMQNANYFTFVLLLNMAHNLTSQQDITFLMPSDRALSEIDMAPTSVLDFLLRHSIPSPLLIDHLEHFPTGSMVPASSPGLMFKVTNDGRERFFLSNVRIISPNICTKGSTIRCHGIDGVVQPTTVAQPPAAPPCSSRPPVMAVAPSPPPPAPDGGAEQAPAATAAPSPSVVEVTSPPTPTPTPSPFSSSPRVGVVHLVTIFSMVIVLVIILSS